MERGTSRGRHLRRRLALAVLAVPLALAVPLVLSSTASAQDPAPESTVAPAPVAEAPVTDAPVTEAPAGLAPSTSAPPLGDRVLESEDATRRLNIVVLALVGLAVVIAVVTVLFWRATRPARIAEAAMPRPSMRWLEADGAGSAVSAPVPEPVPAGVPAPGPDPVAATAAAVSAPTGFAAPLADPAVSPWSATSPAAEVAPPFVAEPVVRRRRKGGPRPADADAEVEQAEPLGFDDPAFDETAFDETAFDDTTPRDTSGTSGAGESDVDGADPDDRVEDEDPDGGPDVEVEEVGARRRPPVPTPRPDERITLLPRRNGSSPAPRPPADGDDGPTVIVESAQPSATDAGATDR